MGSALPWLRRRSALGILAVAMLCLLVIVASVAPLALHGAATTTDVANALKGPSSEHWLGTDDLGRDIAARVLVATRLSLALALGATAIGITTGLVLGAASSAPRVGGLVAAAINVAVAFPGLLLALFFAAIFGAGSLGAMASIGLAMTPSFARLMQTLGAKVRDLDYVKAAHQLGLTRRRVFCRYVLPNIAGPLVINATIAAGSALVVLAALSFLGLGVQPPSYDWGLLLDVSLNRIYTAPASAFGPAAAICFAGIAFTLAGERAASATGVTHRFPESRSVRRGRPGSGGADVAASVKNLRVSFVDRTGSEREVVHGISFTVQKGERVGLVGESGSGKSATALALAGLHDDRALVLADELVVVDVDVDGPAGRVHQRLLKERVGVAFQDAARAFNPALRVGGQVAEAELAGSRRDRLAQATERLASLKVSAPELRARQYPHQLSGGTLQRAMTAMALAAEPRLLIADEPTTALDVTVQAVALRTLDEALTRTGAALLFISHDIAVVAELCDRVLVMKDGHIVEDLPTSALRNDAEHPYTRFLVKTARQLDSARSSELPTADSGAAKRAEGSA
ncbi:dipeptide/oligopeptide/nickel ABC transporter permease/ATP-binding protein [Streptomyces canus]|uniref:dipeptide/oligopeptide/nickel ABC transporter permease/ATP-binding protein n=1 Tax=Streptomyces canus TaxID=58343 RepID=UPI002E35D498|nr:dipeptide/oligopeptide/nickel ABC transporter permease/ATP-binding protein [Streptomyces canus]